MENTQQAANEWYNNLSIEEQLIQIEYFFGVSAIGERITDKDILKMYLKEHPKIRKEQFVKLVVAIAESEAEAALEDGLQTVNQYDLDEMEYERSLAEHPQPEGAKPESNFQHPKNWTDDYPHENGFYMNTCGDCKEKFYGHKRRVRCKICSEQPANQTASTPEAESVEQLKTKLDEAVELIRYALTNQGFTTGGLDKRAECFLSSLSK